jgi:MoxR-like ATPase
MAERKYSNGRTTLKVPLFSLVGASNEVAQEDSLSAMYDRFMLRYISNYVSGSNVVNLLKLNMTPPGNRTTISLNDLQVAQAEVSSVNVEDAVLEEVANLKNETEKEGLKASDRRWRTSMGLLKACAYLDGRDKVVSDDLMVYANVLWDSMQDASKCASIVGRVINPTMTQLVEHADAVEKIISEFLASGASSDAGVQMITKIKQHKEAIGKLNAGSKGEEIKKRIGKKVEDAMKKAISMI